MLLKSDIDPSLILITWSLIQDGFLTYAAALSRLFLGCTNQLELDEDSSEYAVDIYLKGAMFLASLQLSQSTMTTTQVPPGIYRIVVAGGVEPTCLTRSESAVTILPPSAQPDPDQEVIHRSLTSSTVCRWPVFLVANRPW